MIMQEELNKLKQLEKQVDKIKKEIKERFGDGEEVEQGLFGVKHYKSKNIKWKKELEKELSIVYPEDVVKEKIESIEKNCSYYEGYTIYTTVPQKVIQQIEKNIDSSYLNDEVKKLFP